MTLLIVRVVRFARTSRSTDRPVVMSIRFATAIADEDYRGH